MRIPKTLALAVAGGMFLLAPLDPAGEQASRETKVSGDLSPLRLHCLPFSLDQVLNHFNEAFGKRPSRIDERTLATPIARIPTRWSLSPFPISTRALQLSCSPRATTA